jgi:hypothetical protein
MLSEMCSFGGVEIRDALLSELAARRVDDAESLGRR